MTYQGETKSFLGMILFLICFVIGCLFLYWAVQYWVYNNFDKGRYEISKIQPAGGGDSWSFWKLDRRTGQVEYCSLDMRAGERQPDFTCIRANIITREEKPAEPTTPLAEEPRVVNEPVEETASTPATPATSSESDEMIGTTVPTESPEVNTNP